jgi:hypothetical protein
MGPEAQALMLGYDQVASIDEAEFQGQLATAGLRKKF